MSSAAGAKGFRLLWQAPSRVSASQLTNVRVDQPSRQQHRAYDHRHHHHHHPRRSASNSTRIYTFEEIESKTRQDAVRLERFQKVQVKREEPDVVVGSEHVSGAPLWPHQAEFSEQSIELVKKIMQEPVMKQVETVVPSETGEAVMMDGAALSTYMLSRVSTQEDVEDTNNLLLYLRHGDTPKLFRWLSPIWVKPSRNISPAELKTRRIDIAAQLPPLQFSELLRLMETDAVYRHLDILQDIPMSNGMAIYTPLGHNVNQFGVHRLHATALSTVMRLCRERGRYFEQSLQLQDFVTLFRAAGAASDIQMVRELWIAMKHVGHRVSTERNVFIEFARARLLTERLYTQHKPFSLVVRPENRFRDPMRYDQALRAADGVRISVEARTARGPRRFEQAQHKVHVVEHLSRTLRLHTTPQRLRKYLQWEKQLLDHRFIGSLMVAFARADDAGSVYELLERMYRLQIDEDAETGQVTVKSRSGRNYNMDDDGDSNNNSSSSNHYKNPKALVAPSSLLYPTSELLDAIAHSLCYLSRIEAAVEVVTYLSETYKVPIAERTWYDMMRWVYVLASKPGKTKWQRAEEVWRTPPLDTMMAIWETMTSAPFHVRPRFDAYDLFVRMHLARGRNSEAIETMRTAVPLYEARVDAYVSAMVEYAEAKAVGNRSLALAAKLRLRRAAARKWAVWYAIATWCKLLTRNVRRNHRYMHQRMLPDFFDEFRRFLPGYVRYRVASGFVQLREPNRHPRNVLANTHSPGIRPKSAPQRKLPPRSMRKRRMFLRKAIKIQESPRSNPILFIAGKGIERSALLREFA